MPIIARCSGRGAFWAMLSVVNEHILERYSDLVRALLKVSVLYTLLANLGNSLTWSKSAASIKRLFSSIHLCPKTYSPHIRILKDTQCMAFSGDAFGDIHLPMLPEHSEVDSLFRRKMVSLQNPSNQNFIQCGQALDVAPPSSDDYGRDLN